MLSATAFVYIMSWVVLLLKYLAITGLQAGARTYHSRYRYPEDAKLFGGDSGEEVDIVMRGQRVLVNDQESYIFYLIFGTIYLNLPFDGLEWLGMTCFIAYPLFRVIHSFTLLYKLQPWRTLSFTLSMCTMLLIVAQVIYIVCTY